MKNKNFLPIKSITEMKVSFKDISWLVLGNSDIKQKYLRTVLGPFWYTASIATQIFVMGFLLAHLFNIRPEKFLPFLCPSIIFWSLFKDTIQDLATSFISMSGVILQSNRPKMVYIFLQIWKNILINVHFLPVLIFVLLIYDYRPSWHYLLFIPGFILFILNIFWIGLLSAVLSARFRDIPQVITNGMLVIVWLAPIYYKPNQVGELGQFVNSLNPVTYFIEIVRAPLLNQVPTLEYWLINIAFVTFGSLFSIILYQKYKNKIALWL